jgi:hypothetical protein
VETFDLRVEALRAALVARDTRGEAVGAIRVPMTRVAGHG